MVTVVRKSVFNEANCFYAHCVSSDFALGASIAVAFDRKFMLKKKLSARYPVSEKTPARPQLVGRAILEGNVFNLVTKIRYYEKPTYPALTRALNDMKQQCIQMHIRRLAMPWIGCGLDRLKKEYVKEIIESVFLDTDIEIVICQV